MSLSSSLPSHGLIIGFASLKYNQSPCGFDTWTSILIFTTCDKIGTLSNLLTSTQEEAQDEVRDPTRRIMRRNHPESQIIGDLTDHVQARSSLRTQ